MKKQKSTKADVVGLLIIFLLMTVAAFSLYVDGHELASISVSFGSGYFISVLWDAYKEL